MNYLEAHHESLHKEAPPINRLENSIFLICLLSSRPFLHTLCYAKACSINRVDRRSSKIDECIRRQVDLSGIAFFYISLLKSQWCNSPIFKRYIKYKIYLSTAMKESINYCLQTITYKQLMNLSHRMRRFYIELAQPLSLNI